MREATQSAHLQIVTKVGRNLAPKLKLVIAAWLISQFDSYAPAASEAQKSFELSFSNKKRKEVLVFCKSELFEVSTAFSFQTFKK